MFVALRQCLQPPPVYRVVGHTQCLHHPALGVLESQAESLEGSVRQTSRANSLDRDQFEGAEGRGRVEADDEVVHDLLREGTA